MSKFLVNTEYLLKSKLVIDAESLDEASAIVENMLDNIDFSVRGYAEATVLDTESRELRSKVKPLKDVLESAGMD